MGSGIGPISTYAVRIGQNSVVTACGRRYILGAGDTNNKVCSTAHLTRDPRTAKLARMKLNSAAVRYISGLIRAGHVHRGPWSFTAADGNRLLDSDNDGDGGASRDHDTDAAKDHDWAAFGRVHLGIDESASQNTKGRFGYPCAKKDASGQVQVYLHGLLGDISRAGQNNEGEIETAARKLYQLALKHGSANNLTAMCLAIDPDQDDEWRELIPSANAEGKIKGIDGRWWRFSKQIAQRVVQAFSMPLPVDINHSSELCAPNGAESPAQGWIEELQERDGAVWGRINWNDSGLNAVKAKLYRYLSPVLRFNKDTLEVVGLRSVALVNQPNFDLALNHQVALDDLDLETTTPEGSVVDEEIREALGLNSGATTADAVTAINSLKGKSTPSLDQYVPRGDYDQALNRAQTAEQKLTEREKAERDANIETAINAALEAGKITPATAEYHREQCRTEGGLERFQEFVKTAPEVAGDTGLNGRKADESGTALNSETLEVARLMGNSEEDIRKFGKEEAQ